MCLGDAAQKNCHGRGLIDAAQARTNSNITAPDPLDGRP